VNGSTATSVRTNETRRIAGRGRRQPSWFVDRISAWADVCRLANVSVKPGQAQDCRLAYREHARRSARNVRRIYIRRNADNDLVT
jgi:hypothetical protein